VPAATEEQAPFDWAGLGRYREANAHLAFPRPGETRVVFFGDSITATWFDVAPAYFQNRPYLARGVSGQTTAQMLVRFRQDVLELKPAAVVILAGANDIAGNTGPYDPDATMNNLVSMVELARAHRIRVVLASVLPALDYPWNPKLHPTPMILALNARLQDYAARNGLVYLDYYAAMADRAGGLKADLSEDGVHPNSTGYGVMSPLADRSVEKALARK
jgi:lysophospholipase L1-like esterase